jgi:hypothetical protein
MNTRTRACPTGISLVVSVSVSFPWSQKKDLSGMPYPAQSYFGM